MTPFVVLTTQRSGSTWLIEMLDAHPDVSAFSELFIDANGRTAPTFGGAGALLFGAWRKGRNEREVELVDEFLEHVFAGPTSAVGFKLMYGQLKAHEHLAGRLKARNARVVHLQRQNLLRVVLSRDLAAERDQFHVLTTQSVDRRPAQLNIATLTKRLDALDSEARRGRSLALSIADDVCDVAYERLISGSAEYRRILDYLHVHPCEPPKTRLQPIVLADINHMIENFEEVERALRGTQHEKFLD